VVLIPERVRGPRTDAPEREPPILPDPADDVPDLVEGTGDQRRRPGPAIKNDIPRPVSARASDEPLHRVECRTLEPGHGGHPDEALGEHRLVRGLCRGEGGSDQQEGKYQSAHR
jgi:hypothetical protein